MARYIDADKLHIQMEDLYEHHIEMGNYCADGAVADCLNMLDKAPTADVEEVRHGRWLPQVVGGVNTWDCSECKTIGSPQWKRCPICEAKMDGGNVE